jgi:hypothetical protein
MVNVFSGISSAYALVIGAIQIIVGFSLRQSRIWALYLLALNIIIRIVVIIIDQSNGFSVGIGATASILVDLIILLWFFQARDRMKK